MQVNQLTMAKPAFWWAIAYPLTAKAPGWGWQRKCVFVTEAGWYGVDVDTVRGVTLGLTAGTWEWPLVTVSLMPPRCGQQALSPVTLFIFSPWRICNIVGQRRQTHPPSLCQLQLRLNMNIDVRICIEMFLLVECLSTLQPAWSNWHWLAVYCSVQHAHIGRYTHYVPLVSGYRSAKYWPNISQSAKVRTCIAAAAQLLRHQTLSTTVIM